MGQCLAPGLPSYEMLLNESQWRPLTVMEMQRVNHGAGSSFMKMEIEIDVLDELMEELGERHDMLQKFLTKHEDVIQDMAMGSTNDHGPDLSWSEETLHLISIIRNRYYDYQETLDVLGSAMTEQQSRKKEEEAANKKTNEKEDEEKKKKKKEECSSHLNQSVNVQYGPWYRIHNSPLRTRDPIPGTGYPPPPVHSAADIARVHARCMQAISSRAQ